MILFCRHWSYDSYIKNVPDLFNLNLSNSNELDTSIKIFLGLSFLMFQNQVPRRPLYCTVWPQLMVSQSIAEW